MPAPLPDLKRNAIFFHLDIILMIEIGLQPGALYRLLGQPMHAMLPYRDYDGEVVFGKGVKHVFDELANAINFEAMKNIADKFITVSLQELGSHLLLTMLFLNGTYEKGQN